jgi:hypothetical protein
LSAEAKVRIPVAGEEGVECEAWKSDVEVGGPSALRSDATRAADWALTAEEVCEGLGRFDGARGFAAEKLGVGGREEAPGRAVKEAPFDCLTGDVRIVGVVLGVGGLGGRPRFD